MGNASTAISTELGDQAQELPEQLIEKLHSVASRHGGKVPSPSGMLVKPKDTQPSIRDSIQKDKQIYINTDKTEGRSQQLN